MEEKRLTGELRSYTALAFVVKLQLTSPDQWSSLWRSLILSTYGQTVFPYFRYIRVLSLRDLAALLEEPAFRDQYSHEFFSGDLSNLSVELEVQKGPKLRSRNARAFNISRTVENIGDRLTGHTPLVEELDCNQISKESLSRWIPRLKRLQQLRLWNGAALVGTGQLLKESCPDFTTVKFYNWPEEDADTEFAKFLQNLHPTPIKSVEIFSFSRCRASVISALASFSSNLVELKLGAVEDEFLKSLPDLGSCPLLRTFHVETRILESSLNETIRKSISTWLTTCQSLTDVRFINDNPSLIPKLFTPLLSEPSIHLTTLELTRYDGATARDFHAALNSQSSSLRTLILQGDGESADCDLLVSSLCHLSHLRDLHLLHLSDFLQNSHIKALANSMPDLEELVIGGWNINDDVWSSLASLNSLRRLDLNAFSSFTVEGILDYIDRLGDGNKGLSLSINMADPTYPMNDAEQRLVRDVLLTKVEGRFDYALARGVSKISYLVYGMGFLCDRRRV